MRKKPDTKLSRTIYNDAIKQAEKISEKVTLSIDSTVYKRSLSPYTCGTHRILSRFGGYGAHCYKKYHYGMFEFCLTHHTDYEYAMLEVSLFSELSVDACMSIPLTKELWENTDLLTQLDKAHHTMSLDFEAAVTANDYTDLLSKVDDINHKKWVIKHINSVRELFFERSELVHTNKERQQKLKEKLKQLEDEYKCLQDEHKEESARLESQLRETYLNDK